MQPATVSRCGMIYLEPLQLGWLPLVTSWLKTLPEPLDQQEYQELLQDLFNWLIPPSLRVRQKKCKVIWDLFKEIVTSAASLQGLCKLHVSDATKFFVCTCIFMNVL